MTQLSIVIPTLNEADNIDPLLDRLLKVFTDKPWSMEILLADGGSTDGTLDRAKPWQDLAPIRIIAADTGSLAGDVLQAVGEGKGQVILVIDGDQSHPPDVAPLLAKAVLEEGYDMAIGSRYVAGG